MRKCILITGASRGIGRSIALHFAKNNYHVFLNCRKSIDELEDVRMQIDSMKTGSCEIVMGDAGNPKDVRRIFDKIRGTYGRLDVLVNNAGCSTAAVLRFLPWCLKNEDGSSTSLLCGASQEPPVKRLTLPPSLVLTG